MAHRKNNNLHVVRDAEELARRFAGFGKKEPDQQDSETEELEEQVRQHRKAVRRKTVIAVLSVLTVAIAVFLIIYLQTYTKVRVADTYAKAGAAEGNYEQFARGVLKYSRDGISYLNQKGEEKWNQPYQLKNPFVVVNDVSAIAADKGGNDILVFQESGLKGEIHTTLPIEKASVSEQGIVCAILKNDSAPVIICYDTAGNILVEHKTSVTGTGYPMEASISPDGKVMQVVYLYTQDGNLTSKVGYYNFDKEGEGKTDRLVTDVSYEGTLMATGFFMNQKTSVVIGDDKMVIFKGSAAPEEAVSVKIDKEIKSIFHNEKYIGMILKNEGKGGYELRLYNASGKQVLSKDFTGDYNNVKMCDDQIIMYNGKQCNIFTRTGLERFAGEMNNNIMEIFPVAGVNKYIVMNANGMEIVRLVK